jgi:nitric oxide reductase NorD protein
MTSATAIRLEKIIPGTQLNEWERDALLEQLAGYDELLARAVLEQIAVIWPVSHALCFAFLEQLQNGLNCLDRKQLPDWVKGILHAYEADGLRAARQYMADVENNFLCRLRGESGLAFAEARGRLAPYIRGISGRNLQVEPAGAVSTDTTTIFLPRQVTFFPDNDHNFQIYKLLATFQWGFISQDLYCQQHADAAIALPQAGGAEQGEAGDDILRDFFSGFSDQDLVRDIYHLLQTVRVSFFMQAQFPGLMRDLQPFFALLLAGRPAVRSMRGVTYQLEKLRQWLLAMLADPAADGMRGPLRDIAARVFRDGCRNGDIFAATRSFYTAFGGPDQGYEQQPPLLFQGEFNSRQAHLARLARREANKQKFIEALAVFLPSAAAAAEGDEAERQEGQTTAANVAENGAAVTPVQQEGTEKPAAELEPGAEPRFICLGDEQLELPAELRQLAGEISDDLGSVPAFYISSASQRSGGRSRTPQHGPQPEEGQALQGELLYDEWDFRRQGFRKNWCRLVQKRLHAVGGTFVGHTLEKYRGQIMQLKRQFEMMRTRHLFVGRQRDGDDVDLDALTEAHADMKAGLVPSERLYIRLLRDERDIAALFLVDMSSSTEGWVGTALKESLVLLSEALNSLGDRYAIYGFSGMRRTRSEIYHIKDFAETYNDEIRGRIAAIAPVDYTRMGTPIRHFTRLLSRVDAKVRLLVLLTDGKPEDYDDYKGEYAIEDTRHALIEAKMAGIHPFCITIDREAQEYMGHMFGEINYTFINDVRKLPLRVPEIYRLLTS